MVSGYYCVLICFNIFVIMPIMIFISLWVWFEINDVENKEQPVLLSQVKSFTDYFDYG